MAQSHAEEILSDDDFYDGKLTLKEVKMHTLRDKTRRNKACSSKTSQEENNNSIQLIETLSEPILIHSNNTTVVSTSKSCNWGIRTSDDSFIEVENMIEELCKSSDKTECNLDLDNTLDVIDNILKNGPPSGKDYGKKMVRNLENETCVSTKDVLENKEDKLEEESFKDPSPIKVENIDETISSYCNLTPAKSDSHNQQNNMFFTPSSEMRQKSKMPIFKTPGPSSSQKKPSATSLKTAYSRTKAYEHITSPVASYIKKTPQVPLMRDVHPKKPLHSSAIPKFLCKSTQPKAFDAGNINFPSIAYRSAKKTKVIDIPDEEKLPKCQWVKEITTTLPRPVVVKHEYREVNARKPLIPNQEDSFEELSYHQADLSVCTQKSAFKFKKHS